eukprot:Platyproteum_vivax@DN6780_c0_g2_i2.p1
MAADPSSMAALQHLLQSVPNSQGPLMAAASNPASFATLLASLNAQQQTASGGLPGTTFMLPHTMSPSIIIKLIASNPGVSYELDTEDLQVIFRHFGSIRGCAVRDDGSGSLTYNDAASSNAAIHELNGMDFPGVGKLLVSENKSAHDDITPAPPPLPGGALAPSSTDIAALLAAALHGNSVPTAVPPTLSQPPSTIVSETTPHPIPGAPPVAPPVPPVVNQDKQMCRLELIDIFGEEQSGFEVIPLLVGPENSNITHIISESRRVVDIHIRGKPVNHLPPADRLHMVLVSVDSQGFRTALSLCEERRKG